ncbi:MAG TPA: hypothetical protein DD723_03185 [Candidatus Omnitrophica bacterium]|nr:MAG: hypothetical protein A2Z81_01090 [Omnitrophica WOR_2 bacterium GWA2_45_18]HBR14533.1 hypothetical protein [Candidatus Omnitrophota bacterium]
MKPRSIGIIHLAVLFVLAFFLSPAAAEKNPGPDIVLQMDGIISQIDNLLSVEKTTPPDVALVAEPLPGESTLLASTGQYNAGDDQKFHTFQEFQKSRQAKNETPKNEDILVQQDVAGNVKEPQPSSVVESDTVAAQNPSEEIYYDEGLLKEDIREQYMDGLEKRIKIDEAYLEARKIKLPEGPVKSEEKDKQPLIQTAEEIIRGLVKAEDQDRKIDLDFDAVKLQDIFMTLGKAAGVNVVLDPALRDQPLDLHLKQVTLEEAFLLIANSYDLGFKKVEQSLYITGKEKLKEQNVASKVIKLRNISASEAETMVKDLIKKVNVSEEINSLIVVGDPQEIVNVEHVIRTIDKAQPQVILEAKIIEVNRDALKDLGIDWMDSITMDYVESGRPLSISGTVESPKKSLLDVGSFQRTPLLFDSTIKMLENQNKAKVLSNPRVTTLNDKEAEIFVGDRIPFTVTNVTGGVVTTEVQWVEPGIRLVITPSIIEDDFVVIKVEPEVSFIFGFRGPNDEFPHVKTREATAYVRVQNKQPFMLGGLLNQEDKQNLYKVPFLGDVPLLGNLFSYEKHTVLDTELIITITPTIVHSGV